MSRPWRAVRPRRGPGFRLVAYGRDSLCPSRCSRSIGPPVGVSSSVNTECVTVSANRDHWLCSRLRGKKGHQPRRLQGPFTWRRREVSRTTRQRTFQTDDEITRGRTNDGDHARLSIPHVLSQTRGSTTQRLRRSSSCWTPSRRWARRSMLPRRSIRRPLDVLDRILRCPARVRLGLGRGARARGHLGHASYATHEPDSRMSRRARAVTNHSSEGVRCQSGDGCSSGDARFASASASVASIVRSFGVNDSAVPSSTATDTLSATRNSTAARAGSRGSSRASADMPARIAARRCNQNVWAARSDVTAALALRRRCTPGRPIGRRPGQLSSPRSSRRSLRRRSGRHR